MGSDMFSMAVQRGHVEYVADDREPRTAIGYSKKPMESLLDRSGLQIIQPIRLGSWRLGRPSLDYQDVITAQRIEKPADQIRQIDTGLKSG